MRHPLWLRILIFTLVDFPPRDAKGWAIVEYWYRLRKEGRVETS
jgi:hypothetical protein